MGNTGENVMELIIYEGYLRNKNTLCRELAVDPCEDRTETERAILQKGYRKWGTELPKHLRGAFAFAFRDFENGRLFCARDAFGIQSLYYHITADGELLVGPDLSSILCTGKYKKSIDSSALQTYLMLTYPAGEKTLYSGIKKLMPGRSLFYSERKLKIEQWYLPIFEPDLSVSEEEWAKEIDQTLLNILSEDRSNVDFTEGISFISGGVDSSYLLAASRMQQACVIGFTDGITDESPQAQKTAESLGTVFHKLFLSASDFMDVLPRFVRNMELPLADASAVCFAAGCEHISEKTGLCISGEGADEFFAGYHIYKRAGELALDGNALHYGCEGAMDAEQAAKLLCMDQPLPLDHLVKDLYDQTTGCEHLSRMLLIDISLWFEGDILMSAARSARKNGLMVLFPYADTKMFELSARIPSGLKLSGTCEKYILRKAAEMRLPHSTAFRPKAGFPNPAVQWLRSEKYCREIEKALFSDDSKLFFDQELLASFWKAYVEGDDLCFSKIFAVFIFILWYRGFYKIL